MRRPESKQMIFKTATNINLNKQQSEELNEKGSPKLIRLRTQEKEQKEGKKDDIVKKKCC